MNKRLDLTQLEGLGFTQDMLDFMQTCYRDAFAALALHFGDLVIISGVTVAGGNYTDGWVAINGELLPFVGGLIAPNIIIEEITAQEGFADGINRTVYFTRRAKLANSGGNPFVNFVRLKTTKTITTELAQALLDIVSSNSNANNRVAKAGDAMTGALSMGGNKITNLGNATFASDAVPKSQMDAAITAAVNAAVTALINGAPGALDALNELAAAMGNDANFATTVANSIATKVSKAGDVMTGSLEMQGGWRTETSGPLYRRKKFTDTWDMDSVAGKVFTMAGIDFAKIITVHAVITNNAANQRVEVEGYNHNNTAGIMPHVGKAEILPNAGNAQIILRRVDSGAFDGAGWNNATVTLTVDYEV